MKESQSYKNTLTSEPAFKNIFYIFVQLVYQDDGDDGSECSLYPRLFCMNILSLVTV